jgi:hypothetical protein
VAGTNTCNLEGVYDRGLGKGEDPVSALLILYILYSTATRQGQGG